MPQQAYVWQRSWTPAVNNAVSPTSNFTAYVVLAGEVSFRSGNYDAVRVAINYDSLKRAAVPVGLALRIGPYGGRFSGDDPVAAKLAEFAASLLADAKNAGVQPAELQIDFDCADSKLAGYKTWLDAITRRAAPVRVTFTALPSWLSQPQFPELARAAGGYVLQVHSLQRPQSIDAPMTLCDPVATRSAIEAAGRIGVPFRVALPTYGYLVAFNAHGHFEGLAAEGSAITWPAGALVRRLCADPAAMAALVRDWTADRPRCMIGIIWYRLPVSDDALNWRMATLQAVMAGRTPLPKLVAQVVQTEPALYEVQLCNAGDADAPLNSQVVAKWEGTDLIAADAIGGFEMNQQPTQIVVRPSAESGLDRLEPGGRRTIAWLRFSRDKEVHADVSPITP